MKYLRSKDDGGFRRDEFEKAIEYRELLAVFGDFGRRELEDAGVIVASDSQRRGQKVK